MAVFVTETELQQFLVAAGLVTNPIEGLEQYLELGQAIEAATEWLEEYSGYYPFVADAAASARRFSPGEDRLLLLRAGLLSVTWVKTGLLIDGSGGTSLTRDQDYRLLPETAEHRGKPWTMIEFASVPSGDPRSIEIKGSWGYCSAATAAASRAVLARATCELLPQIGQRLSEGVVKWREGDVERQYGDEPLAGLRVQMDQAAMANAPRRVRIA